MQATTLFRYRTNLFRMKLTGNIFYDYSKFQFMFLKILLFYLVHCVVKTATRNWEIRDCVVQVSACYGRKHASKNDTSHSRRGREYYHGASRRHLPQTIESNDSAIKVLMHLLTCLRCTIGDHRNILIGQPCHGRIHPTLRDSRSATV